MDKEQSFVSLSQAVEQIKTAILQGQYEALKDVNRVQLAVYYAIGKYLSENTRKGVWGTGALQYISEQLRKQLPGLRGFSGTQLREMRLFYEAWTMLDGTHRQESQGVELQEDNILSVATDKIQMQNLSVATDNSQRNENQIDIYHTMAVNDVTDFPVEDFFAVPFTHHTRLISLCKDLETRYYYLRRTAQEHWSVGMMERAIKENMYEHQSLIPNNFTKTIAQSALARKAVMQFKDAYALNFINTEELDERDAQDVDEKVVEQKIVQNIKKFIMTFGKDFAFVGNQYHLEIYGVDLFPDLLFFNRELNSLVVVELKSGEFKTSYLGQLMTYLQILDDHVRKPHENPSIGIVLCKSANKDFVQYVIKKYDAPMGVATYTTSDDMPENLRKALPDIEDLKSLLAN